MARDCPFLQWDSSIGFMGGMRCAATRERVETGSALYNNYCHNYESGYSRCPHFKGEPVDNGGCYLTSACVEAMGLSDNCQELTVLRDFRDNWLAKQSGGMEQIEEYYRIAPAILAAMRASADCRIRLHELYREMVFPCVKKITEGKQAEARSLYAEWTQRLKKEWLEGEKK